MFILVALRSSIHLTLQSGDIFSRFVAVFLLIIIVMKLVCTDSVYKECISSHVFWHRLLSVSKSPVSSERWFKIGVIYSFWDWRILCIKSVQLCWSPDLLNLFAVDTITVCTFNKAEVLKLSVTVYVLL